MNRLLCRHTVAFLCLTAGAFPISADTVEYDFNGTLPGAAITGFGQCGAPFSQCPAGQGDPLQFTLPQFNPALGTLQSEYLQVNAMLAGSGTLTNDPIEGCTPGFPCNNNAGIALSLGANGSLSGNGATIPLSFTFTSLPNIQAFFGPDGGTAGFNFGPVSTRIEAPVPSLDPFIGTGVVNFSVSSELAVDDADASQYAATLDPASLNASVIYDFTPATVPEPSLIFVTAAIGGLMIGRFSRNRRQSPVRAESAATQPDARPSLP